METYKIKPIAWIKPGFYCGSSIGIFVLVLAGFSGELFNSSSILGVLAIAVSLTIGIGLGMFLALWLNGLKLKVCVDPNGISSFDFFSSPCSLSWSKMKFVAKTSVLGFPYYVIGNQEREEVWIPIKLDNSQKLLSTIERNLGSDSDVVSILKKLNA